MSLALFANGMCRALPSARGRVCARTAATAAPFSLLGGGRTTPTAAAATGKRLVTAAQRRRLFATAAAATGSNGDSVTDEEAIERLNNELLTCETAPLRLNNAAFSALCESVGGVSGAETVTRIAEKLVQSGVLLRSAGDGGSGGELLNTKLTPLEVWRLVDRDLSSLPAWAQQQERLLATLQQRLAPLDQHKHDIDHKSKRHSRMLLNAALIYLCLQGFAVARLTWWELSWDIMEPVTYMLTFFTGLGGYLFFRATSREYTYETLGEVLSLRKARNLYRRNNLDIDRWRALVSDVDAVKKRLASPEVRFLLRR